VKVETVYAYVSRGALTSYRRDGERSSRFDAGEVEHLARRGRPRRSSLQPALDLRVETGITEINDHRIRYRGHDAIALSQHNTFEEVATLLWTGALPRHTAPWVGDPIELPAAAGRPLDGARLAAAIAATRPWAREQGPEAGARLVATIVDAQPVAGDGRTPRLRLPGRSPIRASVAGRLAVRLTPRRLGPEHVVLLNAALVLLADHELAASTLAARVAASARAGLPAVIGAGLGPLDGDLHGRASTLARGLLAAALDEGAEAAVRHVLARGEHLAGFGQRLYPDGDPRAVPLLRGVRALAGPARLQRVVDDVCVEAHRQAAVAPNIDWALAALTAVCGMPVDSGELIFAVARCAGWIAHAFEEAGERPLRFRARAVYVGPPARPVRRA
jgi:citrate synthase